MKVWLDSHPEVVTYAAVDDAADFEPWGDFAVQTDADIGICTAEVLKLACVFYDHNINIESALLDAMGLSDRRDT